VKRSEFLRKKAFIYVVLVVMFIIASFIYININYLYNPFTYPKGNIAEYNNYSFVTFKTPMVMEVVKWDESGKQSFYHYVTDEKEIKDLLQQFDNANKLVGYNTQQYSEEMPVNEGAEYDIIFRQVDRWDENKVARGRILITFTFYENNNVFEISGAHFYQLKEGFKEDILNALSDKDKWITN
jgi:hypothetical protein